MQFIERTKEPSRTKTKAATTVLIEMHGDETVAQERTEGSEERAHHTAWSCPNAWANSTAGPEGQRGW